MIRVRDDDVILPSSGHSDPFRRLIKVHDIIASAGALHVPGILCGEIRNFPGAVEYVKEKMDVGEMEPQIHGWAHRKYHEYPTHRIVHHLNLCLDFFDTNWQVRPTKFFTPWGGDSNELYEACATTNLELVDCSNLLQPTTVRKNQDKWIGKGRTENVELFIHWWEGVGRLEHALQILNEEI
jgi:hypothetical protein